MFGVNQIQPPSTCGTALKSHHAVIPDIFIRELKKAAYDQTFLKSTVVAIGSINSPMQCMMKEVCDQCLQRHVNPHTGEEFFVFSCFNQDQHLDFVDFKNLNERLKANSIQEKLTNLWLDRALGKMNL